MEKIHTYEQYSDVLAEFKKGRARCSTNRIFMRDELTALIDAGKLFYQEIDGVLWFFSNEGYFYSGNFYVPADVPIRMCRQDMDILVELTGNEMRYNAQWERELIAAGCEKGDRYLEFSGQMNVVIDDVKKKNKVLHTFCAKRGYTYRKATKADASEIWKLWEEKLGKHRCTLNSMTDVEQEETERYGRCVVICDSEGKIIAAGTYIKKNITAYTLRVATAYPASGLGACVYYELILTMYQDGCTKFVGWVRDDNYKSIDLALCAQKQTGKFFWQFFYRADDGRKF